MFLLHTLCFHIFTFVLIVLVVDMNVHFKKCVLLLALYIQFQRLLESICYHKLIKVCLCRILCTEDAISYGETSVLKFHLLPASVASLE